MRLGESDRELERNGLMGRRKARNLRLLAQEQGWLNQNNLLPPNDILESLVKDPQTKCTTGSYIKPYIDVVTKWSNLGLSGVAIHQNLVSKYGFTGGYDCVKRFLAKNRKKNSATVILDYKPGEVGQVDFGTGPEIIDAWTGECYKTWFFVMTLAFSRHQYLEFVLNQKVETWLACHRHAFEFFQGVPIKLIIDNPKCAITRACYYDPQVQRAYAEYAEGYKFIISPCPVRDPQKKGIVESGVKYVKKNFLPLLEPRSLNDLNRLSLEWVMGTAGNRVHGTTMQRPLTSFMEVEKDFLQPLPTIAPEPMSWAKVKLHGNCHVQFEKCFYSAPYQLVHKELWLRATEKTVEIYRENDLVAVHPRMSRPGQRSTVKEHMPPEAQAYWMADPQWCLTQASKVGKNCLELMEGQFSNKVLDKLRSMQGLISLGKKYGNKRLEAACSRAIDHGSPTY
jgi:transposase